MRVWTQRAGGCPEEFVRYLRNVARGLCLRLRHFRMRPSPYRPSACTKYASRTTLGAKFHHPPESGALSANIRCRRGPDVTSAHEVAAVSNRRIRHTTEVTPRGRGGLVAERQRQRLVRDAPATAHAWGGAVPARSQNASKSARRSAIERQVRLATPLLTGVGPPTLSCGCHVASRPARVSRGRLRGPRTPLVLTA